MGAAGEDALAELWIFVGSVQHEVWFTGEACEALGEWMPDIMSMATSRCRHLQGEKRCQKLI